MNYYFSIPLVLALTLSLHLVLADDFQGDIEQLPQMIKEGRMSDSDIAGIIRGSNLPSDIIQDLIDTDLLGEESLKAILETSSQKRTVWDQFLSFFGVRQQSYADRVFKQYQLSESLEQKLLLREDLSSENRESLQQQLSSRRDQRMALDNLNPESSVQRKSFSLSKTGNTFSSQQLNAGAEKEIKASERQALANISSNNNLSGLQAQNGQEEHNSSAEPQGQMEPPQNTPVPEHENSSDSEASSSAPKSSSGSSSSSSSGSGGSSAGSGASGRR